MASIFFQTLMFLFFCSTWVVSFFAALISCENVYRAVCVSSVLWSAFLFALTEGLNLFKSITAANLIISWTIFLIILGGVLPY